MGWVVAFAVAVLLYFSVSDRDRARDDLYRLSLKLTDERDRRLGAEKNYMSLIAFFYSRMHEACIPSFADVRQDILRVFDRLKNRSADLAGANREVDLLRSELLRLAHRHGRGERGDFWMWQDDAYDNVESLTCDVLVTADRMRMFVEAEEKMNLIERLREEEGDVVEILCDNPDFNYLSNNAVECCGHWTEFKMRRFGGGTLLAALQSAAKARFGDAR